MLVPCRTTETDYIVFQHHNDHCASPFGRIGGGQVIHVVSCRVFVLRVSRGVGLPALHLLIVWGEGRGGGDGGMRIGFLLSLEPHDRKLFATNRLVSSQRMATISRLGDFFYRKHTGSFP